jgi:hypothetical protein
MWGEGFGIQPDDATILTTSSSKTVKQSNISNRIMEEEQCKHFRSVYDFVVRNMQVLCDHMHAYQSYFACANYTPLGSWRRGTQ